MTMSKEKRLPDDVLTRRGQLIADFYAYNAKSSVHQYTNPTANLEPGTYRPSDYDPNNTGPGAEPEAQTLGVHWVDDLAVEAQVDVQSDKGEVLLDLVRSGVRYQARLNVADGKATLNCKTIEGEELTFVDDDGKEAKHPTAQTTVKGPGSYRLRLSNCDHEVLLWVNGTTVEFDGPTTYLSGELADPAWTPTDAGDLTPAGIGSQGAAVKISDLQIYRDKYYIAISEEAGQDGNDYIDSFGGQWTEGRGDGEAENIRAILANPDVWSTTTLFNSRRGVQFQLEKDQFFPMGDNSPYSYDARLWVPPHCVERDLLIGKALLIYWPHSWNRPVPFTPNFSRMGRIR
jgi:signal peptidase I